MTINPANTICVLLGKGDGTFSEAPNYKAGASPNNVAVAESRFRRGQSGQQSQNSNFSVLLGNGDDSFQPAVSYAAGLGPGTVSSRAQA
jgi:hypothetical protein